MSLGEWHQRRSEAVRVSSGEAYAAACIRSFRTSGLALLAKKMPKVVLYSTSVPVTMKLKHEILRIQRMLTTRKIEFEEVDVAVEVERRNEMEPDSTGARKLPQLFIDGKVHRTLCTSIQGRAVLVLSSWEMQRS